VCKSCATALDPVSSLALQSVLICHMQISVPISLLGCGKELLSSKVVKETPQF